MYTHKLATLKEREGLPIEKIDLSNIVCPKDKRNYCYLLKNVLTVEECQEIINRGEKLGFNDKGNSTMKRIISDDADLAEALFKRMKPYLPESVEGHSKLVKGKSNRLVGLNARFRCGRYLGGDYFHRHCDVEYMPQFYERLDLTGDYQCSTLTVMIYLNSQVDKGDGLPTFKGGRTHFVEKKQNYKYSCVPQAGMAIIFTQADYELMHEGEKVTEGSKYMLRTDVMYEFTK
jgi:hypothetical protein